MKRGLIEVWHDGEITPGSNWGDAIKKQLSISDIILAIVSPDFLMSDYIWDIEMKSSLIRYEEGKTIIIPIIARNCLWQETPFSLLQALPTDAKPISMWENVDAAINDVIKGLNRVINAPIEIQEQGIKALKTYYEEIQNKKSTYIDEVKLILVGNGEVGKSTIANNLVDPSYGVPNTLNKRTSGLKILKWLWQKKVGEEALNINNRDLVELNFNIWDFGGQGRYRIIQQLFCSRNSIYLFVTSKDDKEKNKNEQYVDFEYWIPFINAYGYDIDTNKPSPIIHIRNKIDLGRDYIDERNYIDSPNINIIDFIKISCRKSKDIEKLVDLIIYSTVPILGNNIANEYPTSWVKTKNELETKKENYITLTKYQEIAKKNNVKEDGVNVLLKLLDSIGTILMPAIKNRRIYNRALKDIIILNPDWFRKAIGLVLDSRNNGKFSKNDFDNIWQKYKEMEKDLFIDLMIAFELCYFSEKDNRYVVPVLLSNQYTITKNELPVFTYEFEFSYFIPAGFVHKLIIRLYQDNFEILEHWRNGAIIKYQKCKAKVTEHWHTRRITINLFGDNINDINLLRIVLNKKVNDIIDSLIPRLRQEDLKIKENIICNCKVKSEFCRFEIETLKRKRDRGQVYIDCHQNQENQIPIITLMNYNIKREKKRVFLSYAQEDATWLKKLKKHLSTVRRNEKIETWDDAEIIAGNHWEKEVLDKLYQADIIILLITSNFIDSDFCYEKELKIALERHEKKAAKVVPIILEYCDLEDILFDELKTLPSRKNRVVEYKDENEAFVEIAKELKNIL